MNRYKQLISNTVIFAIGTFSSKVLVFLLMPLYTRVLTGEQYGVVDLILQAGNLLLPLASVGIINSIIRFGLDSDYRKSDVFSTGLITICCGFVALLGFWPLLNMVKYISGNMLLIYIFVLMSSLRSLCAQFVRARGLVRLFAFDGILSTLNTIIFNILYLVVFKMGILGYILAIVTADSFSVLFLFVTAKLYRFVKLRGINGATSKAMLRYAIPLIPATMLWWITSVSDRYIVSYMLGSEANGLYAVSYKIPSIVILVSGIFMDAWQMSAVTENKGRERFFTKVFRSYEAIVFTAASGLILFAKVIIKLLVAPSYYPAWQYIPFLVTATTFSCFVSFLGSIYVAEKKSVASLITAAVGTVVNVVLNIMWIPKYGVNGAGFATFLCYLVVFVIRAVDTRRYVKIQWNTFKILFNTAILLAQSFIMILELPHWIIYEAALTLLMMVTNMGAIFMSLQKLLHRD